MIAVDGSVEDGNGRWDLVEINSDNNKVRGSEWGSAMSESDEVRGEKEDR